MIARIQVHRLTNILYHLGTQAELIILLNLDIPWPYSSVLGNCRELVFRISKHKTIWPNVAGSFVQIARSANVPVVLDAGGADTPISQELLKCVTVLRVNEAELARLTGLPSSNLDQISIAAMSIHQLVCSHYMDRCNSVCDKIYSFTRCTEEKNSQTPFILILLPLSA